MEANKILSADLLDLIFDNRNKDYGAYDLRRTYTRRIKKALLITTFVFVAIAAAFFANSTKTATNDPQKITEVTLESIEEPEEEIPLPEPEQPPPAEEPVQMERFLEPEIVPNEEVTEPPPTQAELKLSEIGDKDQEGKIDEGIPTEEKVGDGKGIVESKKTAEPDEPFVTVEVPAKFIGDWARFLLKNLNAQVPVDNGAPAGNYRVMIRFVVDKDGNVSDIVPLTNLGYGMEQEAIRVLKKAPKWIPAIQNGYQVKAYHTQLIKFEVYEDQ